MAALLLCYLLEGTVSELDSAGGTHGVVDRWWLGHRGGAAPLHAVFCMVASATMTILMSDGFVTARLLYSACCFDVSDRSLC